MPGLAAAALAATLAAPLPAAALRVATGAQPLPDAGGLTVAAADGQAASFHDAARAAPGGRSDRRAAAEAPAAQPPGAADAQSAQAGPEPRTYALFLAGLGAVGWFASRRHPRQ